MLTATEYKTAAIAIRGVTVQVNAADPDFVRMLEERYAGFIGSGQEPDYEFDIELAAPADADPEADVGVFREGRTWHLERGDFRAQWDPALRRGRIRQSANPYSIDAVLRIVHSLVLAGQGGMLVHAASAVRNGRAFLFAGVSGAGKTTISRLAPPDATLLTDEISYLRREEPATPPTAPPLPENSASRARTSARRSPRCICWPKAAETPSSRWAPPRPRGRCWKASCFLLTIQSWWDGSSSRRASL